MNFDIFVQLWMETEFDTFADIHVGDNISNEYIREPFVE